MIQIGDKVKFTEYLPKNYLTSHNMKRTLDNKRIFVRHHNIERKDGEVHYNIPIVKGDEYEGVYVGSFHKKLSRQYRLTEQTFEIETNELINGLLGDVRTPRLRAQPLRRVEAVYSIDRYSVNPRRIDNPRKLTKLAMLNHKGRLIAVPMSNIYKCNYSNLIKVL